MLSPKEIEFIKEKLTEKFRPEKVILFGSQARMDSDKNSDVDLLVITNPNGNRRKLMLEMDRALKGLNYARDIVILSSIEFEKDKLIAGTIARYAFKEGRIIYGSEWGSNPQIYFPYTHSITRLLEICAELINTDEFTGAEMLTSFAITTRYPGEDEEVTKEEALEAIRVADLVKEKITIQLTIIEQPKKWTFKIPPP